MSPGRSILIIDDDTSVRQIMCRILTSYGYTTIDAPDGDMALHLAQHQPPTVIVLDLGLPYQDGYTVAHRIRTHPTLASVPIVAITGYPAHTLTERAQQAGCQRLLQKPFPIDTLIHTINDLLRTPT